MQRTEVQCQNPTHTPQPQSHFSPNLRHLSTGEVEYRQGTAQTARAQRRIKGSLGQPQAQTSQLPETLWEMSGGPTAKHHTHTKLAPTAEAMKGTVDF